MLNEKAHQTALAELNVAAKSLTRAMDEHRNVRILAFERLEAKVRGLQAIRPSETESDTDAFSRALDELRFGMILVDAGHAADSGDASGLASALTALQPEATSEFTTQSFKSEYLRVPEGLPEKPAEAFCNLIERASGTLDEIANEAGDVISSALTHVGSALRKGVELFSDFAEAVDAADQRSLLRGGVDFIVNGLKAMLALLERVGLEPVVQLLEQAASAGDAKAVIALAIHCNQKKAEFARLHLADGKTSNAIGDAARELAASASRFVGLMNQARWLLKGVGAGALVLAFSPAAHVAAMGAAVSYAVIAAAVLVIAMQFADFDPVLAQVAFR